MRRFYAPVTGQKALITGTDVLHITGVLRMGVGQRLLITHNGFDYMCAIEQIDKDTVYCSVTEKIESSNEPEIKVTLYQGLPKADKMEYIIQKAVELGVHSIVPVACERSVVKLDAKDAEKKAERWQRIAQEAAKQCGRGAVPIVSVPKPLFSALDRHELGLLLWEAEQGNSLMYTLNNAPAIKDIAIIIGPEGGITDKEADKLKELSYKSVTLGKRILRTETASLAALSAIMYHFGELG